MHFRTKNLFRENINLICGAQEEDLCNILPSCNLRLDSDSKSRRKDTNSSTEDVNRSAMSRSLARQKLDRAGKRRNERRSERKERFKNGKVYFHNSSSLTVF